MNKFILNCNNIIKNILTIKKGLTPNTKFCAMVKANAYGHGIKAVCKHISTYVDYFGVAVVSEGLILRNNNIHNKILVVGAFDKYKARLAIINNLELTVCSLNDLIVLTKTAQKLNIVAKVHIKINTGMNRIGVNNILDFKQMLQYLKVCKYIKLVGVFSHFSCSDSDKDYTKKQNAKLKKYIKLLKDKSVIKHISSSYASINYKQYNYDMVRVGLAIYGYGSPSLTPAIKITSNIKEIITLNKNSYIGYGATFKTTKFTKIATVGLGYADGIDVRLSNNAYVNINNTPCKILGKICMDMFMCDVTNLSVSVGQEVVVFDYTNNATYWKNFCDCTEYQIITNFKTNRMKVIVMNK